MELTQENVNWCIGFMQALSAENGRSIQLVEIDSGTKTIKVRFTEIGDTSSMTNERLLELLENHFKKEIPDCAEVVQVL